MITSVFLLWPLGGGSSFDTMLLCLFNNSLLCFNFLDFWFFLPLDFLSSEVIIWFLEKFGQNQTVLSPQNQAKLGFDTRCS
jgi:hypothetical protein